MTYLLLAILLIGELQVEGGAQLSHVFKLPGIEKELKLKSSQIDPIHNASVDSDFFRQNSSSHIEFTKEEEDFYKPLVSAAQFKRARQIRFQENLKWGCIPAAMAGEGIEIQGEDLEMLKVDSEDLFERIDAVYKKLRYDQSKELFSKHFSEEKLDAMFGPEFDFKEAKFGTGGFAPTNHLKARLKKIREEGEPYVPKTKQKASKQPNSRRR